MIAAFFPLKKLRRSGKHLLFGVILLLGLVAVYHEMVAEKARRSASGMHPDGINLRKTLFGRRVRGHHQGVSLEDSAPWTFNSTPQPWHPEYKGQANLHVFEDWCGSSTADLFKNLHYPLYPHSRTTVQKLAISPQWTNYGLRIFGYLHPYTHGEFVFSVSSDDNSEFWLSTDDSPNNLQLLAWVGKTGREWTAPGEFEKYASQTSRPLRLSAQKKYFFEVIHKQNDRGTDHVEVAWKLPNKIGFHNFKLIESRDISLYVNESALLMSDVAHIPQTAASHQNTPTKEHSAAADMLREDPRDSFYQVPLINSKFLHGVLPDCSYKPSYSIKDFPLLRYQGLQFIHMSYIYPNDYTRLTHMETENSCFYHESSFYKMFRSSRFMKLDRPENENTDREFGFRKRKSVFVDKNAIYNEARPDQRDNELFSDYGDDFDDYAQNRRRKLFSVVIQTNNIPKNTSDKGQKPQTKTPEPVEPLQSMPTQASKHDLVHLQQNPSEVKPQGQAGTAEQIKPEGKPGPIKLKEASVGPGHIDPLSQVKREQLTTNPEPGVLSEQQGSDLHRLKRPNKTLKVSERDPHRPENLPAPTESLPTAKRGRPIVRLHQRRKDIRINHGNKKIEINTHLQQDSENSIHKAKMVTRGQRIKSWVVTKANEDQAGERDEFFNRAKRRGDSLWGRVKDDANMDDEDEDENATTEPVFDTEVNWSQTFQVLHHDLQAQRSDLMDTQCMIAGNLLLQSSDVLPIVNAFMKKFNEKHNGQFSLERVVNVVRRVDRVKGSRYLLELELKDVNGQLLRLSHYIYTLVHYSMQDFNELNFQPPKSQLLLCNPVGFRWNPDATIHFILPVKNQARWVLQMIADMEQLHEETGDNNFSLVIIDFNSTDMDVRKALQKSKIPRYQYVKLEGNFERSAGLQAGIDLIDDDHSILFLCDLHIFFPSYILDAIRKHCVEGYMAFAPIVLRLDCGATPSDAKGYWEANGFGLLGIYKSDMDAVGGMNTREFKDRWGGEDWELIDRILQAGLEVERIFLRNFFHHYHSKRGMWNRRVSSRHQ